MTRLTRSLFSASRGHRCHEILLLTWLSITALTATAAKPSGLSLAQSATITVDSSTPGYGSTVLNDGHWLARGEENPSEWGPMRLGNGGNSWVSSDQPGEHWIILEWPQPVTLNEVEICWSIVDWCPRAFRIEREENGRWISAAGNDDWLTPTDRQSVIPLPQVETRRLRIFQPEAGASAQHFLSAQEILVFHRIAPSHPASGTRKISPQAFARLTRSPKLVRNIARLNEECPGSVEPLVWDASGKTHLNPSLADGEIKVSAATLSARTAVGFQWPVRHAIDGVALVFSGNEPATSSLVLEADDGERWVPVQTQLAPTNGLRRIEGTFLPVVTRALRVRLGGGKAKFAVAEMSVFRFLPTTKNTWPDRFTGKAVLQQEILSVGAEPSFATIALRAHSMQTARAFVGLKDDPAETGVGWEGTLFGREKIQFRFGPEEYTFAEFADTTRRALVDGWRPGVVIEGRLGDIRVRETVFAVPLGEKSSPVVFIRFSIRNLSSSPRHDSLQAILTGERTGDVKFDNGLLRRGKDALLIPLAPSAPSDLPDSIKVDFTLEPGEERHIDFLHPQQTNASVSSLRDNHTVSFAAAQAQFRRYWDEIISSPAALAVPEARINCAVKAVLAQIFVTADGNMVPYGATPSVYEGGLFGVEEGYSMVALALFGHGAEAQRYFDGAYLTKDFLKKAAEYKMDNIEARHQQYRNGLEPYYAVSAWRLTRDDAWMRRHLPLLKECAEWTLAERRHTMKLENGSKPLHWGLLPKWAYGGDIMDVLCYPIYPNLACWRGLMDTAELLDEFGDKETARRYRADAAEFRVAIDRAMDGAYLPDKKPPFLPLSLYSDKPDEQLDYYQLFAGCVLDVEAFEPGNKHQRWITDYLEESNRMFCHLPRFRQMGTGALDALYGKGYFLSQLREGATRDFLLSLYAYFVFNMDHDTFVSRESNVIYTSDLQQRSAFMPGDTTDPLVSASAVSLHLIRHMLVTEEAGAKPGEYSGNLLLLSGIPRAWLEEGKEIKLREMPTHFGPMSLEVRSTSGGKKIEARLTPPARQLCRQIKLRLRQCEGLPIRSLTVNGQPWRDFDPSGEWIVLPGNVGAYRVTAKY